MWWLALIVSDDLGSALVDQESDVFGSQFERVVLFERLRCAFDAMVSLNVCDCLNIIDHVSTAGQGDGERLRDGIVGHIDTLPRLSSGSISAVSAENEAKNTLYVVEAKVCLEHGVMKCIIVPC